MHGHDDFQHAHNCGLENLFQKRFPLTHLGQLDENKLADYLLKPVDDEELARLLQKLGSSEAAEDNLPFAEELSAAKESRNPYVQAVWQAVVENYRQHISLEQIAADQLVSLSYISRKLKEETGQIKWEFELEPSSERTLNLAYDVAWPKDKKIQEIREAVLPESRGGRICPECGARTEGKFCTTCGCRLP